MGNDRVLIGACRGDTGATDAGVAYLFSTNGTLLTTFTNPTPAANDYFGYAVVAVGSDRVLIAAYGEDTGALNAGAAYLFNTNGTLLTTFTNPTPAADDRFGISVAALGSDRVLIGSDWDDTGADNAGAAYLLSTNGTLLTTFTNPTPATDDYFGAVVAAVGSDRVLIGARTDDTGAINAGAAYLFNTNGALLTTFTKPIPAAGDGFGVSVAAVGSERVLIGSDWDDTGASDAGAAFLFSTNGALLATFTKPNPTSYDHFGISVAAVGNDRVLIAAYQDDTGATDAGAAYLFTYGFPLSTNADLAGLVLNAGTLTPAFDAALTNYTVGVSNHTSSVTITPTSADTNATIQVRLNGGSFSNVLSGTASPPLSLNIGTNLIDVRVTAQGLTTIKTYTVAVTRLQNQPPVANAGSDQTVFAGDLVSLQGSATDPDGDAIIYWIWNATGSPSGSIWNLYYEDRPTAQFQPLTAGDYLLVLAVVDANHNGSLPDYVIVHVYTNQPPVAIATADKTNGVAPLTVCFDGSQSYDPEGATLSYYWYFGDGSDPASVANVCHTFAHFNTYMVTFGLTDEHGAVDSKILMITVLPPAVLRVALTSTNTVLLAWSAALTGYDLQQNADLATTNWLAVTNPPVVVGSDKQVIVNPPTGNRFYRLNKP